MLQATFLKSAASRQQYPADDGAEVAFAGRSNSGKSSTINAILNRRGLARASKTPGRTQMLQFFAVGERQRIVDLPGYGYAAAPLRVRRQWEGMMGDYFQCRRSLRGVFVVVDARRGVGELDLRMLDVCAAADAQVHLLMNKCDRHQTRRPDGDFAGCGAAPRRERHGPGVFRVARPWAWKKPAKYSIPGWPPDPAPGTATPVEPNGRDAGLDDDASS